VALTERKAVEAERRQCSGDDLSSVLTEYARAHGDWFLLFGSAARETVRYNSDVDILTDFPQAETSAARDFAERACWDRDLQPDVVARSWCKDDLLTDIERDIEVISRAP
jgi:Nucleotidyltransferase domain